MTISPTRLLGGGIAIEENPFRTEAIQVYRGVDLGGAEDPSANPYRSQAAAPTPVIVRMMSEMLAKSPEGPALFQRALASRVGMGGPAPRLLKALGRGGLWLALVEEFVTGTPLSTVLQRRESAGLMPVSIALAIGQGLMALWTSAPEGGSELGVDPYRIVIDDNGQVRVMPSYEAERVLRTEGAAIISLSELLAYATPEQIQGVPRDARNGMFLLGLLLYEMLGGSHPMALPGVSMFELLSSLANTHVPPLLDQRPELHPAIARFVHRCLERDPAGRFDTWAEAAAGLTGVRALVEPAGPAEIDAYVHIVVPQHPTRDLPSVESFDGKALWSYHFELMPLPPRVDPPRLAPRPAPVIAPGMVYLPPDARPMYALPSGQLIDARPVTRAEIERFFLSTRTRPPPHLLAVGTAADDDPCTYVPPEVAEAYARWAGKRLPTEAEWQAAVDALGAERLGMGSVWEWTSTPCDDGGFIIRGGRWRDLPGSAPSPRHRSFAIPAAPDVGFRCVADPR